MAPKRLILIVLFVLALDSSSVAAQFVPQQAFEDHAYAEMFAQLFEAMAEELNEDFQLPRPIGLTSGPCQQANAFYIPDESRIVFCAELAEQIVVPLQNAGLTEEMLGIAVVSQILFVLLHEIPMARSAARSR